MEAFAGRYKKDSWGGMGGLGVWRNQTQYRCDGCDSEYIKNGKLGDLELLDAGDPPLLKCSGVKS